MDDAGLVYTDWMGDRLEYRIIKRESGIFCLLTAVPVGEGVDTGREKWQSNLETPSLLALATRIKKCSAYHSNERVVSAKPTTLVLRPRDDKGVALGPEYTWPINIHENHVEKVVDTLNRIRVRIHHLKKDQHDQKKADPFGEEQPASPVVAQTLAAPPLLDRTDDLIRELATLSATLRETNTVLNGDDESPREAPSSDRPPVWSGTTDLAVRLRQLGVSPEAAGREARQLLRRHQLWLADELTRRPEFATSNARWAVARLRENGG